MGSIAQTIFEKVDGTSALVSNAFCDELVKKGVNCRGYGILFKFPMLDSSLSIEAKGIYCYICSYAGSDNTAFPGREKILTDLQMCKDSYYRHYQQLLEQDYIRVEQRNIGGNSHGFMKNIYEIVENPEKFFRRPESLRLATVYDRIRSGGLHEGGFGYIPRAVMTDPRLSVKAKALYGYYRSFSGAGTVACPEKKDILYHLGISAKLYQKLMGELLELNYLTAVQRHVNGRLSVNDICIVSTPTPCGVAAPRGKRILRADTEGREGFVTFRKQDTQKRDTQRQDAQNQDTQKQDSIKIKQNKNNMDQNPSDYQQQRTCAPNERWKDLEDKTLLAEQEMAEQGTIPVEWLGQRDILTAAVAVLTGRCEAEELGVPPPKSGSAEELLAQALIDLLCTTDGVKLTGQTVTAADVRHLLTGYLEPAAGSLRLVTVDALAIENYRRACCAREIRNPLGYMEACLWSALKAGDAALRAEIARDLGY